MADIKILNNDIVSFEGNVGINTANPGNYKLYVTAGPATSVAANFYNPNAGYSSILLSHSTGSAGIASVGNNLVTTQTFVVGGTAPFTTGGTAEITSQVDATNKVALSLGFSNTNMSYIRQQGNGIFQWQTYNSGNSGELHLQPYGGNVGIGTTSPSNKFHVAGDTYLYGKVGIGITPTTTWDLRIKGQYPLQLSNSSSSAKFEFYADLGENRYLNGSKIVGYNQDLSIDTTSSSYDILLANNGGNVGIGTTTPTEKLQVNGVIRIPYNSSNSYYYGQDNGTIGFGKIFPFNNSGLFAFDTNYTSGGGYSFKYNGAEKVRIKSDGNVGINTSSPNEKLHVAGNIHAYEPSGINAGLFASTAAGSTTIAIRSSGITHFNGGNVGIGTTSPADKLDVAGDIKLDGVIYHDTDTSGSISSGVWYRIIEISGGSGRGKCDFTLDSTGGSGTPFTLKATVNTNWGNSGSTLVCHFNSYGSGVRDLRVVRNSTSNKSFVDVRFSGGEDYVTVRIQPTVNLAADTVGFTNVTTLPTGDSVETTLDVNGKVFSTASSQTSDNLVITYDNKLGVGTTSPDYKLQVNDSIYTALGLYSTYSFSDNRNWAWRLNTFGSGNWGGIGLWQSSSAGTSPSSGQIRLGVDKNGNVGIGTTSPSEKLHVEGRLRLGTTPVITSHDDITIDIDQNNNQSDRYFRVTKDGESSELFRVQENGNVGIGTTSPLDLLHIKSTTTDARMVLDGASGFDAELKFFENGTVKYTVGHDAASGNFVIGTDNVDTNQRLVINSSGNVGIGTTSPAVKLDLSGGIIRVNDGTGITYYEGVRINSYDTNGFDIIGREGLTLTTASADKDIVLLPTGNVGINTTTPSSKLQVDGDFNISNKYIYNQGYTSTTGAGVANGTSIEWKSGTTAINTAYNYRVRLTTAGTGTNSGATYLVEYDPDTTTYNVRMVSRSGSNSNHPLLAMNGTTMVAYTNHTSSYPIQYHVEAISVADNDGTLHNMGADYHWQRDVDDLYYIDGDVGIGNTSPSAKLDVSGFIRSYTSTGNFSEMRHGAYYAIGAHSGTFMLDLDNTGTADLVNIKKSGSSRFYIQNGGNVGIGTTSPVGKLTISQNVNSSTDFSWLVFDNQASGYGDWNIYKSGNNNLAFGYGTSNGSSYTNAVTLAYGGRVGIGTTTPDGNLEVVASTTVSGASDSVNNVLIGLQSTNRPTIILDTADTTYTNRTWNITNVGSAGTLRIGRNGLDVISLKNDGKIGIGTDSPSKKLEIVSNTTYDGIQISGSSIPTLGIIDTTNNAKFVAYVRDSDATIGMESNHPLTINTNNTERIRILANGQVGIGVTSVPTGYKMQVDGSILSSSQVSKMTISNIDYFGRVGQYYGAMQLAVWNYNNSTSTQTNTGTIQLGALGPTTYQNNVIVSNGNLTVNGNGSFTGDVVAYSSSDKRLKDNVKPIENALDKVIAIGGYEFDWNDNQEVYEGHDVGVIAQEVEEVLPEVVETRKDGYKAVKYEKMVPLLIEAIKDQQKQIEELKALLNGSTK